MRSFSFRQLHSSRVRLQSYDAAVDIPHLASEIQRQFQSRKPIILEAFRVAFVEFSLPPSPSLINRARSITELPHKLPHYVALLQLLSVLVSSDKPLPLATTIPGLPARPVEPVVLDDAGHAVELPVAPMVVDVDVEVPEEKVATISTSREIISDIAEALQVYLGERKWRSARYCVSRIARFVDLLLLTPTRADFVILSPRHAPEAPCLSLFRCRPAYIIPRCSGRTRTARRSRR